MYDADLTGDQRSNCYINMINNRIDRYINLFSDLSSKWQTNIQKTLKHKTVFSIHFAVFLLHSHKIFFKILTVTVATNFDIFPNSWTRISYVTWSFPLNKSYTNDSCIYIHTIRVQISNISGIMTFLERIAIMRNEDFSHISKTSFSSFFFEPTFFPPPSQKQFSFSCLEPLAQFKKVMIKQY